MQCIALYRSVLIHRMGSSVEEVYVLGVCVYVCACVCVFVCVCVRVLKFSTAQQECVLGVCVFLCEQ